MKTRAKKEKVNKERFKRYYKKLRKSMDIKKLIYWVYLIISKETYTHTPKQTNYSTKTGKEKAIIGIDRQISIK